MKPHVMSISDFAKYKGTSRQTVYNNLSDLTTDDSEESFIEKLSAGRRQKKKSCRSAGNDMLLFKWHEILLFLMST